MNESLLIGLLLLLAVIHLTANKGGKAGKLQRAWSALWAK